MSFLVGMALLGAFSLAAQVLFLREMLVAFHGNEISIGLLFAVWLLSVGSGASLSRAASRRMSTIALGWTVFGLLVAAGLLLPGQLLIMKQLRALFGVSVGELAPIGAVAASSLVLFAPTCLAVGFCFPSACRLLVARGGDRPVSAVYIAEAVGAAGAGLLISFVLLPHISSIDLSLVASTVALLAGGLFCPFRKRLVLLLPSLWMIAFALLPIDRFEETLASQQWRAQGVLLNNERSHLAAWGDSVYQDLAVIGLDEQYTVYGNGQVMFTFPDPIGEEHRVHTIMAQKPDAGRLLVLGGNPLGDLYELLKYPNLESLVFVDLDPMVRDLVAKLSDQYEAVFSDPRVEAVAMDGIRFAVETDRTFDIIIVNAPHPSTTAANRFYSREFYRLLSARLDDGGFLYSAVDVSARLESETLYVGASVYATLQSVFPEVKVTSGGEARFFAAKGADVVTLDRQTLYENSRAAQVETLFFEPDYLLWSEELDPVKAEDAARRYDSANTPINTLLRPVTCLYELAIWSRLSESGLHNLFLPLRSMYPLNPVAFFFVLGLSALSAGAVAVRRGVRAMPPRLMRTAIIAVLFSTGLCSLAFELVMILLYQGFFGYVYTKAGLIFAVFMLGLLAGGLAGRKLAKSGAEKLLQAAMMADAAFVLLFAATLTLIWSGRMADGSAVPLWLGILSAGLLTGLQFPVCSRLLMQTGSTPDGAAAAADTADHLGAAAGSLAAGVLLLPVFGVATVCGVLASIKIASMLTLFSCIIVNKGRS